MPNQASKKLTIAIPTGRLRDDCLNLLELAGGLTIKESSRKLLWETTNYRILEVKPVDVPVYVQNGVADCGFVGKDTLMEFDFDVYELLDCNIGKCRLSIAQPESKIGKNINVIASKYSRLATKYCKTTGLNAKVIRLNGSVEIAPLVGLADAILDIVDSGRTLKANGLKEIKILTSVSVRLIANKASFQVKSNQLDPLINQLQKVIKA